MSEVSGSSPGGAPDTARLGRHAISNSQYLHYIPQFLLKNYSFPSPKRKRNKTGPRIHRGDPLLRAVKINSNPPEFEELLMKRTFGNQDMYMDDSKFKPEEQSRVEDKLGRLEQVTGLIILKVITALHNGREAVVLSRTEKDTLRKFLFVMKYRGPNFFRRFNHQSAEEYEADDKEQFCAYMRSKNFARPLDVWFDNLIAILDAKVDAENDWAMGLSDCIYHGDWIWLFINTTMMHLAFCTPSDPNEEFILTENSFGIHEGPVSFSTDRRTGESTTTSYTEYHNIAVISPRLMILLRSNMMPDPVEDKDEKTQREKAAWIKSNNKSHVDPEHAGSLLEDLPVTKAKTSDSRGGKCLLSGDGVDSSDQFHFTFFNLSSGHTQMLNSIMLDQGSYTSLIVYKSQTALRKALEFYLDMPPRMHGMHSMKTISDRLDDPMKLLLNTLEHIAHELGSDVKARYHIDPLWENDSRDRQNWLKPKHQDSFTLQYEKPEDDNSNHLELLVLKLSSQTLSAVRRPIESSAEFWMRLIRQVEYTVEDIYAIDLIRKGSGELDIPSERIIKILQKELEILDFPSRVFKIIQTNSRQGVHPSQDLSWIPLLEWRLSWYSLCSLSFKKSGRTVASAVQMVQRKYPKWNDPAFQHSYKSSLSMAFPSLQKSLSDAIEIPEAPTSPNKASKDKRRRKHAQNPSGLSRSGISQAFDQIGQALVEEQTSVQSAKKLPPVTRQDPIPGEQGPSSVQPKNLDSGKSVLCPEHVDMAEKSRSTRGREHFRTNATSRSTSPPRTNPNHEPAQSVWTPILIVSLVIVLLLLGSIQLIRLVLSFIDVVSDLLRSGFSQIYAQLFS